MNITFTSPLIGSFPLSIQLGHTTSILSLVLSAHAVDLAPVTGGESVWPEPPRSSFHRRLAIEVQSSSSHLAIVAFLLFSTRHVMAAIVSALLLQPLPIPRDCRAVAGHKFPYVPLFSPSFLYLILTHSHTHSHPSLFHSISDVGTPSEKEPRWAACHRRFCSAASPTKFRSVAGTRVLRRHLGRQRLAMLVACRHSCLKRGLLVTGLGRR